jgi:RHS repeat-associated protein
MVTGTGVVAGQTWLYSYDEDGNVLTRTGPGGYEQSLTWDTSGELTQVTTNGASVGYGYDELGRRVRRTAPDGAVTYTVWAGDDLAATLDANGQATALYTYEPGVDRPLSMRAGGVGAPTYTYALDALGNVVGLLDAVGTPVQVYRYGPFGEQEADSGGAANALRWKARELDPVTGFYYMRARWYDATAGRFLSEDPIGLGGGINEYAFAGDDPVNGSDPSGMLQIPGFICVDFSNGVTVCRNQQGGGTIQYNPPVVVTATRSRGNGSDGFGAVGAVGAVGGLGSAAGGWMLTPSGLWQRPDIEKHHGFPQEFEERLRNKDGGLLVNIDNHAIHLPRPLHRDIHSGPGRGGHWNSEWRNGFFKAYEAFEASDLYEYLEQLIEKYALGAFAYSQYRKPGR